MDQLLDLGRGAGRLPTAHLSFEILQQFEQASKIRVQDTLITRGPGRLAKDSFGAGRNSLFTVRGSRFLLQMVSDEATRLCELDLVQRSLQGEDSAVRALQEEHGGFLKNILRSYGASESDSEEILAVLWVDCVVALPGRRPIFERFHGKSALRSWLAAIVVNRWISRRRNRIVRVKAHDEIAASMDAEASAGLDPLFDPELLAILEKALREACAAAKAEEIVVLHLVHFHGLTQREVAALWGWHESQVSRLLNGAEEQIARSTLGSIARKDPMLDLKWGDLLQLCEGANLLLF